MPKGPQGQRRPADVIGNAVHIAQIATGEIEETKTTRSGRVKSGKSGGVARAKTLSSRERSEIAKNAANIRWSK